MYFLIVVCVGGAGTITGPFVAALLVGIVDVAGKYYLPEAGAFLIYVVMIIMLLARPNGIIPRKRPRHEAARACPPPACEAPRSSSGSHWLRASSCCRDKLTLMSQIVIFGLFAVSLDMALGYAGILTVGHAAFFGAGAYAAGPAAKHGWGEPLQRPAGRR